MADKNATVLARLSAMERMLQELRERLDATAHAGFELAHRQSEQGTLDPEMLGDFAYRLTQCRSKVIELEFLQFALLTTQDLATSSRLTSKVTMAMGNLLDLETLVKKAAE